jgi:hypothetical protein
MSADMSVNPGVPRAGLRPGNGPPVKLLRWESICTRALLVFSLFGATACSYAQDYHLPFSDRWFVMQGGDTLNVNEHMRVAAQWFGADFVKVGGPSGRALVKTAGSSVEDFYSWGEPVLSPVEGEVIAAADGLPDNALGGKDEGNPAGNHVVIKTASNRYVYIAHLKRASITVKPGQHVTFGQTLGRCGNSGNSDFPHIHMHVQDTATLNVGTGQNVEFSGIAVELSGKQFRNVKWPLIRGLFVANE